MSFERIVLDAACVNALRHAEQERRGVMLTL